MTAPTLERVRVTLDSVAQRANPKLDCLAARISGQPKPAPPANPWAWPGIYLGAGTRGPVWSGPERHTLVVGPPRSGKTTSVVIPTIALHRGPVVATSTKHDLVQVTAWRRSQLGRCWLWDPTTTAPMQGVEPLRWSPLQGCEQ